MKKEAKIKLDRLISNNISSREAIQLIEDKIFCLSKSEDLDISLDFSNINFISKSFADEVLKLEQKLKNKKIHSVSINLNDNVRKMLKISVNRKKKKQIKKKIVKPVNLEKIAYQF